MKRILPFGFALALLTGAFGACTMDFDQFQPGVGGGGAGGTGGACAAECCAPSDCPAPADPCMQATCNAGSCGEEARPDGAEAGTQNDGDCQKVVCQAGAPTSENDDTDTPDDGNDCTADSCAGGTPASDPVAEGTACATNGGKVCTAAGACVECVMDGDCPMNLPNCDTGAHKCVDASCGDGEQNGDETDTDCGGSCAPCGVGDDCLVGEDCTSGVCSGQGGNKACAAPTCSDTVKNGNETDQDCGGSCPDCGPGKMCGGDNDCAGGDCSGGTCVPNCEDGVQNNAETDTDCGGGTCPGCAVGDTCMGNGDCASGNCQGNTCGKLPTGSTCGNDNQCQSNNCDDGVCCSTSCNGTCRACNLPGSVGTCTNIPSGQDPANECAGQQVCNGLGACKKVSGQTCSNSNECLSNFCVDGVCCNTVCSTPCMACDVSGSEGTCTAVPAGTDPHNDCSGGQVCDAAGACVKVANGQSCSAAGDCTSNFCVDGVCCDAACGGLCQACNVTGSVGTCSNVPAGTDPAGECPGMQNCDGAGACN